MSIKSEIVRIIAAKADLKRAINSKGGSIVNEKLDQYAAAVDLLNPEECGNRVRFIDYDGTILSTAYIADGGSASPPEVPEHENLKFYSWNRDYENITGHRDIGACFTTETGSSYLKVRMTVNTGYTVSFKPYLTSGTLYVDWGDGTTSSYTGTGTKTVSYTYADYGDYTITFRGGSWYPASYFAGGSSSGNTYLLEAWLYGPSKIEANAFYRSYGLRKVMIGSSIQTIGNYAFYECTALTAAVVPDSVTSLGTYCFNQCRALSRMVLPDSLTKIPDYCFSCCKSLDTVTVPDGVTVLESQCFYYCVSLREIDLPPTLLTIEYRAFQQCSALHKVKIPDGVTTIDDSAFNECITLEEARLPATLTSAGSSIFGECTALRKVTLAPGLKTVPDYVCSDCNALEEVVFPSSVATIESGAFYDCSRLLEVNIPVSVTSIGSEAFYNCNAMRDVIMNATKPPTLESSSTFSYVPDSCIIWIPKSVNRTVLTAYQTATNWSNFADYMREKP